MAQRLRIFGLLTAVVLGLHACVGRGLEQRMDELRNEAKVPARMNVVYMQTIQVSAPPPAVATPPAPTPPPPSRPAPRTAPPTPAVAASAPESAPEPIPELAPETVAEPTPPTETAPTDSAPSPEAVPPTEPAASAVATPSFDWPTSTRVRYRMGGQYNGELHGTAQVEWLRSGDRYQVFMDVSAKPLFERRMRSEGLITPEGLAPQRYDQETKQILVFGKGRQSMLFDADGVTLANGQRAATLPGVQDTASQFVQLTYLFRRQPELLRPGTQIEMPLALPGHVNRWIFEVMQPEIIYTPMGPIETFHLKPRRAVTKANDLKAEIWFAPTLQYLPVRIRIVLDENTFLDLLISEAPQGGQVQ